MSKVFFTSDNHFYHTNILKYSARPFFVGDDIKTWELAKSDASIMKKFRPSKASVENMNEEMIRLWNETVKPEDTVYLNGDFAFATKDQIIGVLERLNGNKHFNFGNHDQEILKHRPDFMGEKRFQSMRDYRELTIEGEKIIMCHFAMRVWNKSHRGAWMLFGHSHGTLEPMGKSVDVGVDAPHITGKPEYAPISFHAIKKFMDKQKIVLLDHHDEATN